MGVTIPNIFVDLLILVLPLPMLWRLQMDMKKKILLTANFMLGYWYVTGTASTCLEHSTINVLQRDNSHHNQAAVHH